MCQKAHLNKTQVRLLLKTLIHFNRLVSKTKSENLFHHHHKTLLFVKDLQIEKNNFKTESKKEIINKLTDNIE